MGHEHGSQAYRELLAAWNKRCQAYLTAAKEWKTLDDISDAAMDAKKSAEAVLSANHDKIYEYKKKLQKCLAEMSDVDPAKRKNRREPLFQVSPRYSLIYHHMALANVNLDKSISELHGVMSESDGILAATMKKFAGILTDLADAESSWVESVRAQFPGSETVGFYMTDWRRHIRLPSGEDLEFNPETTPDSGDVARTPAATAATKTMKRSDITHGLEAPKNIFLRSSGSKKLRDSEIFEAWDRKCTYNLAGLMLKKLGDHNLLRAIKDMNRGQYMISSSRSYSFKLISAAKPSHDFFGLIRSAHWNEEIGTVTLDLFLKCANYYQALLHNTEVKADIHQALSDGYRITSEAAVRKAAANADLAAAYKMISDSSNEWEYVVSNTFAGKKPKRKTLFSAELPDGRVFKWTHPILVSFLSSGPDADMPASAQKEQMKLHRDAALSVLDSDLGTYDVFYPDDREADRGSLRSPSF